MKKVLNLVRTKVLALLVVSAFISGEIVHAAKKSPASKGTPAPAKPVPAASEPVVKENPWGPGKRDWQDESNAFDTAEFDGIIAKKEAALAKLLESVKQFDAVDAYGELKKIMDGIPALIQAMREARYMTHAQMNDGFAARVKSWEAVKTGLVSWVTKNSSSIKIKGFNSKSFVEFLNNEICSVFKLDIKIAATVVGDRWFDKAIKARQQAVVALKDFVAGDKVASKGVDLKALSKIIEDELMMRVTQMKQEYCDPKSSFASRKELVDGQQKSWDVVVAKLNKLDATKSEKQNAAFQALLKDVLAAFTVPQEGAVSDFEARIDDKQKAMDEIIIAALCFCTDNKVSADTTKIKMESQIYVPLNKKAKVLLLAMRSENVRSEATDATKQALIKQQAKEWNDVADVLSKAAFIPNTTAENKKKIADFGYYTIGSQLAIFRWAELKPNPNSLPVKK